MKRIAMTVLLKDDPEVIRQYEEYHANVWPQVIEGGRGAPAKVTAPKLTSVQAEIRRAQALVQGLSVDVKPMGPQILRNVRSIPR